MKISFPLLILSLSFTLLLSSCNYIAKNKIIGIWSIQEPIEFGEGLMKCTLSRYQIKFTASKAYVDSEIEFFGRVTSIPVAGDYSIDGDRISFSNEGNNEYTYFTIENNFHELTADITSQGLNLHLALYKIQE